MKNFPAYFTLLLVMSLLGCSKGPYHMVTVESYLLRNDYLYALFFCEDGVDESGSFADNVYAVTSRERLVFARVSLGGLNNKFEVLGAYDQPKGHFHDEAGFMLVSSNAAFVETRAGGINLIQCAGSGGSDTPTGFAAGDLFYNSDHSVLFSKPNPLTSGVNQTWAVATFSLSNKSDSVSGISGLLTNAIWPAHFAVTPDCSAAMVQTVNGDPTNFLFCEKANNYRQEKIVIPIPCYAELEGMFNATNRLLIVMKYFESTTNVLNPIPRLMICDERGVEIADTRMDEAILPDKELERIIYIPQEEVNRIVSISEMSIRIWSPFTGANQIVKVDVTAINQALLER